MSITKFSGLGAKYAGLAIYALTFAACTKLAPQSNNTFSQLPPPVVSFQTFNEAGVKEYVGGLVLPVKYSIESPHSPVKSVSIYFSSNGGNTYSVVAENIQNSGSYEWDLGGATSNGKLKIVAVTESGLQGFGESSKFKIDDSVPEITLVQPASGYFSSFHDGGSHFPLRWKLKDVDVGAPSPYSLDSVTVEIRYSLDNGGSWKEDGNTHASPMGATDFKDLFLAKDLTTRDLKIQLIAKKTNGKSFELVTDKILVDSHSPKLDFSTNPVLSNSSKSVVYAGEKVIINWSATDGIGSGISNVSLKVPNVSGGMSTVVLSGGAGSYEFIVPNISKSSAKIELTATDSVVLEDGVVGHTSVLPTPFFEINNSIPANAPSIALISPVPPSTSTFLRKVDGSITDCRTNHFYLVSLSATKPASTDSGFKPCSVGTLFSQPLPADGPQSVYIWGRKGTSLVSNTSVKVDVNVDTTPIGKPSVPTPALAAFYKATPISVALSGCPLNSKVLVSETNTGFATAPLESDSRWVVCGSSVAFNPPSPPLSEGPHSL